MHYRFRPVSFLVFSIVLSGCVQVTRPVSIDLTKDGPRVSETKTLPDYISRRRTKSEGSGVEATFLVLKIDPAKWSWEAAEAVEAPKSVAAWRDAIGADIVINAAYFTASGTPSGFWRNASSTPRSRRDWPNEKSRSDKAGYTGAVLVKDGALSLAYLPEDDIDPENYDTAFLTYPTLIADGQPVVLKESGLFARRTVLAEDADGDDYVIVTEEGSATLYGLSRWLAEQPESFVRAVNLDGGPSTGLALEDGDTSLSLGYALIPNVLAVRRR